MANDNEKLEASLAQCSASSAAFLEAQIAALTADNKRLRKANDELLQHIVTLSTRAAALAGLLPDPPPRA